MHARGLTLEVQLTTPVDINHLQHAVDEDAALEAVVLTELIV
jgi:hypothetical protein